MDGHMSRMNQFTKDYAIIGTKMLRKDKVPLNPLWLESYSRRICRGILVLSGRAVGNNLKGWVCPPVVSEQVATRSPVLSYESDGVLVPIV